MKKKKLSFGPINPNLRAADLERIRRFRLLDDIFMRAVLQGNIAGVQDIVRVILGRNDIFVTDVKVQDELTNLYGHGVRLDVLAKDSEGRLYNIEIQRDSGGAGEKRARYNLGAIDWYQLPSGAEYDLLAETYVIFITEEDIWGDGLPVYTVERTIKETGRPFNDQEHILYANGAYVGEDDRGKLMADFRATDPERMNFSSLADKAAFYKNTEGGQNSMCRIMEEVREEGIEIGIQLGIKQGISQGMKQGMKQGISQGVSEGRKQGISQGREQMIDALLMDHSEEDLLHSDRFARFSITPEEIEAAKRKRPAE